MTSDFKKYTVALEKARRIDANRANDVVQAENIMGGVQYALLATQYKRASKKTLEELGLAPKQVAKKKTAAKKAAKPVVTVSVGTNFAEELVEETLRKKLVKEQFKALRNRHQRLDHIPSVGCGL